MGAKIQRDESGIWVVGITGALRKEELDAVQAAGIRGMNPEEKARVLILVAEDFAGWVGGEVWHDLTFLEHGDRIGKIAIVGDPRWETKMLMFTGAGFRPTQVRYFTPGRLVEARDWLGEETAGVGFG